MIIKEYGKYRAICDNCENDLPPTESYDEARKQNPPHTIYARNVYVGELNSDGVLVVKWEQPETIPGLSITVRGSNDTQLFPFYLKKGVLVDITDGEPSSLDWQPAPEDTHTIIPAVREGKLTSHVTYGDYVMPTMEKKLEAQIETLGHKLEQTMLAVTALGGTIL